jgi:methylphosphotriester-DNA--protein-cysteine methyltransferase
LSLVSNQHLLNEAISLPVNGDRSFAMNGVDVPLTGYEDAEATVHRLIKVGTLDSDPVVAAAWNGSAPLVSHRSLQRRFRSVTGMSHRTARQIERASEAVRLLQQGVSILDTVDEPGYRDQAHLTRSLRRWTGQTPAKVVRDRQASTMA